LVAAGRPTIRHAETFTLAGVGRAHAYLESGKALGKVTLQIK
jgi:Zinc-binding dehydrogenase